MYLQWKMSGFVNPGAWRCLTFIELKCRSYHAASRGRKKEKQKYHALARFW
jgi:hypothetical protein